MKTTIVVNMRIEERKEGDILIARPSPFGNPFKIGTHGNRKMVILKYTKYLLEKPDLLKLVPALRGRRLRCWCAPKPCHGDILVKLANSGKNTSYDLGQELKKLIEEMEHAEWRTALESVEA